MDLAILHHFPGGISLFERSEVSLFLYAKSISNFTKARDPPPFLEHDGQIFIHPSNKVEILNTHFSNIANILYNEFCYVV
jgi:hypothetical protein